MSRFFKFVPAMALLLTVTAAYAGPLGIDLNNDTPQSLGCIEKKAKGTVFDCSRSAIPKPLPDFDNYTLSWREGVGICQLTAASSAPNLGELKDEYTNLLTKKYGEPSIESGMPIWRGEDDGVSVSVVLFPLRNLVLQYWFDENGRNCSASDGEKLDGL